MALTQAQILAIVQSIADSGGTLQTVRNSAVVTKGDGQNLTSSEIQAHITAGDFSDAQEDSYSVGRQKRAGFVPTPNAVQISWDISGSDSWDSWFILGQVDAPIKSVFDTGTTDANPGTGEVRFNNATQGSATFIYVNDSTDDDIDYSNAWLSLNDTDYILLYVVDDISKFHLVKVNGTVTDGTTYVKIPITVDSSGSSFASGDKIAWMFLNTGGGGGGAQTHDYQAGMMGSAQSTTGKLAKAPTNTSNPGGLPTTDSGGSYSNGQIAPFEIVGNQTITDVKISVGAAAVSQGTKAGTITMRIAAYTHTGTSRTGLADFDVELPTTNVGVSNNVGGTTLIQGSLSGLSESLSDGDLLGFEFENLSSTNAQINAASEITVTLKSEDA